MATQSNHHLPVAENIRNRQFAVAQPNPGWDGHITDIWAAEGWLYLTVLLHLHSLAVIGWAMGRRLS